MLVACCHIPGCRETCGARGWLCHRHGALLPPWLRQQLKESARAARSDIQRGRTHSEWQVRALAWVLVELWVLTFPVPPEHVDTQHGRLRGCPCPLCQQAARLAVRAHADRRYVQAPSAPVTDSSMRYAL